MRTSMFVLCLRNWGSYLELLAMLLPLRIHFHIMDLCTMPIDVVHNSEHTYNNKLRQRSL